MVSKVLERKMRRTSLLFALCLSFLLGIGAVKAWHLSGGWWWVCLVSLVPALRSRTWWTLLWIVLLGASFGLWRGGMYQAKLAQFSNYYDQKVTITAVAKQDAAYDKYKQLKFDATQVTVLSTGERLTGKISISGFGLNAVFAGDEIQTSGKLQSSLGSYQGRMSFAEMALVAHHDTRISELRRKFTSGVQSALPEPIASFGMGLLIGQRNNLPPEVSQALLMVGLTHIIAVSGYNLTILLHASEKLTGKRSKRVGLMLSLGLIFGFLLLAGTSASIVRAAIVSVLSIAAGYYGRKFKPLVLLSLAAAITAFASPYYVWSDTSWYLSFLAFFGVMLLAPRLQEKFPERWRESLVLGVALESICAEAMTLPFILHTFGQMSFVGLLGNVLVTALVPLAMLLTAIAGLAGMTLPMIAGWFAWPAKILLTYMLDIANLLSHLPHVFAQNIGFSMRQMLFCYGLLGFITYGLNRKTKGDKSATITDKNDKQSKEMRSERSLQMVHN